MLDYEWGNPSAIMLSGDEPTQDSDPTRQIFDPYSSQAFTEPGLINPNGFSSSQNHPQFHHQQTTQTQTHFQSMYDLHAYSSSYPSPATAPGHHSMLSLEPAGPGGYMVVPKSEPVNIDYASRIGLNLGVRTYFSSAEDDFVNRLYRRSRGIEPGSVNSPRCQAEGCNADLTHAKHYHRRHKVCEFHSKAATVVAAGLTQRFCQQCSRFHLLSEFDNGKRSCRRRLADHNRRRRKSNQTNQEQQHHKSQPENARQSTSEKPARSSPDSGVHLSSSVTIAISPPRMSLDCFGRRSYGGASASDSTGSLFFSSG